MGAKILRRRSGAGRLSEQAALREAQGWQNVNGQIHPRSTLAAPTLNSTANTTLPTLEDAATEFQVQGLELDWTCVTAKEWVRDQARGTERFGLVASSKAMRLKPHAIDELRRNVRVSARGGSEGAAVAWTRRLALAGEINSDRAGAELMAPDVPHRPIELSPSLTSCVLKLAHDILDCSLQRIGWLRVAHNDLIELMPAVIILIQRIVFKEQLRQSHLISDEPLAVVQRLAQALPQPLIGRAGEYHRAVSLVVRRVAIEILEGRVHNRRIPRPSITFRGDLRCRVLVIQIARIAAR